MTAAQQAEDYNKDINNRGKKRKTSRDGKTREQDEAVKGEDQSENLLNLLRRY